MHYLFKDLFNWSKKERIGVIILSGLLIGMFLINVFFEQIFLSKQEGWNQDSLKYYLSLLDTLEKDIARQKSFESNKENNVTLKKTISRDIEYFPFDPNSLSKNDWVSFGFTDKQASVIINYKKKIGRFKTKEDLARCFVIDDKKLKELAPFIRIDTTFRNHLKSDINKNTDTIYRKHKIKISTDFSPVEINGSDSTELLTIYGIGPYFANKIISYRNKLGGFYRKEQLLEIWNFDSAKYQQIENHIIIDSMLISKININTVEIDDLKMHPYFRWYLANAIIKYKDQHGYFEEINDLKKVAIMTDSIFNKITPYLVVD